MCDVCQLLLPGRNIAQELPKNPKTGIRSGIRRYVLRIDSVFSLRIFPYAPRRTENVIENMPLEVVVNFEDVDSYGAL